MASTSASLFSRAAPLQTSYDGAQTLWYPALRSTLKPKVVLIFICGNPGLASFYTKFLTTIHRHSSLKGRIEIFAVSHRGHALVSPVVVGGTNEAWSAEEASQGIRTSLYDQVRHKVDILDSVRRVYPRAPAQTEGHNGASRSSKDVKVVLVGHSIGAYIALEVLRARRRDVDGIHLLFPTLSHIAQTPNAKIFTMQPASSAQSTAELLLTRGAVINALAMARDEMRIVQGIRPEIKEAVRSFVRRRPADGGAGHIHAYWGKGESDGWTPSWLRAQVEDELRMDRVTLPNARNDVQQPNSRHRNGTLMVAPFQTPPPSLRSRSSSMHLGASPRRRTSTLLIPGGSNEPLHSPTNGFSDSEPPHSPPSSMRLRQLSSAIAKRNFDGSITIERAVLDSDEESNKASTVEGTAAGSVLGSLGVDDQPILFEDPDEISSSDEQTAPGKEKARDGKRVGAGLLTSTVCEIGMPHAFCLKFGTEMGNIVAQWIQQDHF
ncbi:unnamed protein product [Tilletia controversa]|uniref:Uncharacterized protein n=1 Tax=Tilletia laevis TaxID=157183 RepID=A0A9N8M520_9BASI|nr:unnamed protein product [Tilletia caries]CAD6952435.1 unnamed protein product [Tilletia controversa]CAD6957233.1 unnamed protein product [Tilletia laevis]